MLRYADELAPDAELIVGEWGQSNAGPWGHKALEGDVAAPHLSRPAPGMDLTMTIRTPTPAEHPEYNTVHGVVGSISVIDCAETLPGSILIGGEVRLVFTEMGEASPAVLPRGHAKVVAADGTKMVVRWLSDSPTASVVTFDLATEEVIWPGHGRSVDELIQFFGGTLPTELSHGVDYRIAAVSADRFTLKTVGGTSITLSGSPSGTTKAATSGTLYLAGYVHLHDKWKTYDNVRVLLPYQPEQPGDYPAGPPVVPGYSFPADVTEYRDCALYRPFSWFEGVEGVGYVGTATVVDLVVTVSGVTLPTDVFIDGFIRVGPSRGIVASNTASTVTVKSWTPAAPGPGSHNFELCLPHWRSNANAFNPGYGFRYPSNHLQPGGHNIEGNNPGRVYNRPRGDLVPSYVKRTSGVATVRTTINSAGQSMSVAASGADFTIAKAGDYVRITFNGSPTLTRPHFKDIFRPGHILLGAGFAGTDASQLNQLLRVVVTTDTYIDVERYDGVTFPGSITITATAGTALTRLTYTLNHRFGSAVEMCSRLANSLRRRINLVLLSVNGGRMLLAEQENLFAFRGDDQLKIGWFDDSYHDWTPSRPGGSAERFVAMLTTMSKNALIAEGNSKKGVVGLLVGYQGEGDALSPAGRESYEAALWGIYGYYQKAIEAAGMSPYRDGVKVPVVHALITHDPWELSGNFYGVELTGDTEGVVNAAIKKFVAVHGVAKYIDTNDSPKLDGTTTFGLDKLHFNAYGEYRNGKLAAEAGLELMDFAMSMSDTSGAVEICNLALSHLGDGQFITSLDDDSEQARRCKDFYPMALKSLLQRYTFQFACKRVALTEITSEWPQWQYAYVRPADVLRPLHVLPPDAIDDFGRLARSDWPTMGGERQMRMPLPPFETELGADGVPVILTNQESAVLRYVANVTDTRQFSPLVKLALSHELASYLAGSNVRGEDGVKLAAYHQRRAEETAKEAEAQDAKERNIDPPALPDWVTRI